MKTISISIVKYKNTIPFRKGIEISGIQKKYPLKIEYDVPAECAKKLINDKVDIGLIPVASIINLDKYHIISDYCLGAYRNVKSVLLCSNIPFKDINTIKQDNESMSSNYLTRILYANFWKKNVRFIENDENNSADAHILIGDKALDNINNWKYHADLSESWFQFTGLPFVFAAWVTKKELETQFLNDFNTALSIGVNSIDDFKKQNMELFRYLKYNMDYKIDNKKKKAIYLFLDFIEKLSY
ncbi:MAG: menaquinone biosynthesis protein [Marinilabiliales bacterium]